MNTVPVVCQRCGAPLIVVDESVRFVTCAHCNTPLEIVRESTQAHSRILEQIQASTEESAKALKLIALQQELERIDREWERHGPVTDGVLRGWEKVGNNGLVGVFIGTGAILCVLYGLMRSDLKLVVIGIGASATAFLIIQGFRKASMEIRQVGLLETEHHLRRQKLIAAIENARRDAS